MNLQEKQTEVANISEHFKGADLTVLANFQGCTCAELTSLRNKLRTAGAKFAVVKNTLAKRALNAEQAADQPGAVEQFQKLFKGPTAVIWTGEDLVTSAKVIKDFCKEVEKFQVKGGLLGEQVLSQKDVEELANMPTKEQLFSNLLALINAPATKLLQTINAPATQVARVLNAWKEELEKKN